MTVNMSFFGGSPFATPVGQRIEQATDASLSSENWALNMEVCDIVNGTEEGPKDAIKAIRKRLQQNAGKNYTVFMYTLTVLETCVKNCGMRFRVLACNKEFVLELTRLIGPKYDPPRAVQDKVLSLIQSWSDAFSHLPDLAGVTQVYHDLKQKGIEFPMTDLDSMAPIHTPQRSVPEADISIDRPTEAANLAAATGAVVQGASQPPTLPHAQMPGKPSVPGTGAATPGSPTASSVSLSHEQLAKLRSELEVVQGNAAVLNEMLAEVEPGKEHPSDLQLLQELFSTCRAMQVRLVELIGKVAHDELTADLLRINDQLNNLFLRYGRFVKNREAGNQAAATLSQDTSKEADESLIDLSEEAAAAPLPVAAGVLGTKLAGLSLNSSNVTSQLSRISSVPAQHGSQQRMAAEGGGEGGARGGSATGAASAAEDTEFDMFAQSRNVTYESSKAGGSTYKDNLDPDQTTASLASVAQARSQPVSRESDFREMEAWLEDRPEVAEESLTSSEFERFLAERAAAADALPTVPVGVAAIGGGVVGGGNAPSGVQGARRRQKEGEDEAGAASLFAL